MITTQATALCHALRGFQKVLRGYLQALGSLSVLTSLKGQPARLSQPPKQKSFLKARDAARLIRGSLYLLVIIYWQSFAIGLL